MYIYIYIYIYICIYIYIYIYILTWKLGLHQQVALLNFQECTGKRPIRRDLLSTEQHHLDLEVARSAALALWSCSISMRSRSSIFKAGAVPLLAKLIKQDKDDFLVPVVGLVQECSVEVSISITADGRSHPKYLLSLKCFASFGPQYPRPNQIHRINK